MQTIDLIQTIGVIFSILLGTIALIGNFVQLKALIKQLKSSTWSSISTRLDNLNRAEFDHPEVYKQLSQEYNPDDETQYQATLLMDMRLNLYQDVYIQHKLHNLIDKEEYKTWEETIKNTLQKTFAQGYWRHTKQYWIESFRNEIENTVDQLNPTSTTEQQLLEENAG